MTGKVSGGLSRLRVFRVLLQRPRFPGAPDCERHALIAAGALLGIRLPLKIYE